MTLKQVLFVLPLMAALVEQSGFGQVPGTKLWEVTLGTHVFSSPAIGDDGTIYVGVSMAAPQTPFSTTAWVYAISPQGTTNWMTKIFGDVLAAPAIGSDGTIYVGTVYGYLYALNPNGATNWVFATGQSPNYGFIGSCPALGADGTVYFTGMSGYEKTIHPDTLYAVRPDGTTNWVLSLNRVASGPGLNVLYPSPAIGPDGTIYVATRNQKLFAINPNGTTNWVFSIGADIYSSPTIGPDGTIYLGADDYKLHAITPRGFEKWAFQTGSYVESSAAITENTIYIGSLDQTLYALDFNGNKRWAVTKIPCSASPPIGADGSIYLVGTLFGQFYAFNSSGSNTWRLSLPADNLGSFSSPAIGTDGTIYFGAGPKLYAVSGTKPLMNTAWPMFRGNLKHTARSIQRGVKAPTPLPDGNSALSFNVETGRTYQVEYSTNLIDWGKLTNFNATTFTHQFSDLTATNSAQRYYRLATEMP